MIDYLIISDTHFGSGRFKRYKEVCDLISTTEAKKIIFNGDIFETSSLVESKKKFPEFFSIIENKDYVFIQGNHDRWADIESVKINIDDKRVIVLHGHQVDMVIPLLQDISVWLNELSMKILRCDVQGLWRRFFEKIMPNGIKMLPMLYRNRCRLIDQHSEHYDIIISGHIHYTEVFHENSFTYYTASIMDANSFITIKDSKIILHKF